MKNQIAEGGENKRKMKRGNFEREKERWFGGLGEA